MGFIVFAAAFAIVAIGLYLYKGDSIKKMSENKPSDNRFNLSNEELIFLQAARDSVKPKNDIKSKDDSKLNEDKVFCSYCDSYIDIDDNENCPNCGASLKDEIEEYRRKKAEINFKMMQIEAEMEKNRQDHQKTMKKLDIASSVAKSAISPVGAISLAKTIKKYKKD